MTFEDLPAAVADLRRKLDRLLAIHEKPDAETWIPVAQYRREEGCCHRTVLNKAKTGQIQTRGRGQAMEVKR